MKHAKLTKDTVDRVYRELDRDWTVQLINDLPVPHSVILYIIAVSTVQKPSTTVTEVFQALDENLTGFKLPGRRRIQEIINELENQGHIKTWNLSQGKRGLQKHIQLNHSPHTVIHYYTYESDKIRMRAETT